MIFLKYLTFCPPLDLFRSRHYTYKDKLKEVDTMKKLNITAVVVAAGSSTRMGGDKSKLLMMVGHKTVIRRTLEVFENTSCIDSIVLVTRPQDIPAMEAEAAGITKLKTIVPGGNDRQASVLNGVMAAGDCDYIAIHDGARPLVTPEEIELVCADGIKHGAATLSAIPKDTVKIADSESFVSETPDRSSLRLIYTPQVFERMTYLDCVDKATASFTDDCQLFESQGRKVFLSQGKYTNIKITTPEDIPSAQAILGIEAKKETAMRIGHGYDVHKLVEGRKLIMGGVEIPHETGLLGHSDADVLCHAISDALLGAAAMGDIGHLFPDNDPAYKGADSVVLLKKVVETLREGGYRPVNIDATIIAQRPKMMPHIMRMRENIAGACGLEANDVSVKATTEEKLGFTGREEGISAHAVALICKI